VAPIQTSSLRSALSDKGFKRQDTHHEMWWFWVGDQRTTVRTRISQGSREYDDYLLGLVAREMHLKRAQLNAFVECSLSGEAYREHLIASNVVRLHGVDKCTRCSCDGWRDPNNDGKCENTSIPGQQRARRCGHEKSLHTRS
jgi:hypothetical protein